MKSNHEKYLLLLKAMISLNILFFVVSLVLSGKNLHLSINPFTALSPSTNVLISLGAAGKAAVNSYIGQLGTDSISQFDKDSIRQFVTTYWWVLTLVTSNWLHGSLLHIVFNMIALFQIGSLISAIYGFDRMFIIYTLSGIAGFYLSLVVGISVTIGASAAICGLLGAGFYFGRAQKNSLAGRAVSKMASGWILSLVIFGVAIPNINNWGHGGGFAAGILIGWLLGYNKIEYSSVEAGYEQVEYIKKIEESGFNTLLSSILMLITIFCLIFPFVLLFLF
ncbi:MAG: rhomboid family intramembrane serine protease [Desulfamplus sp.]|nr:rhomboid family intramembrane serine protease [Desulfamplus sp.]